MSAAPGPGSSPGGPPPDTGPLRLSWFVPPLPLLVARERGLPVDAAVTEARTPSSAEQFRALAAGELDLAVTAIDNLAVWGAAGVDLRLVAQVERTTPLRVYGAAGAPPGLAHLAGRRFAVDAATNGFALVARRLLADAGATARLVEVGGVRERLDALLAGTADATLLGPPYDALADEAGLPLLADVAEALPAQPGQGLVARAEVVGRAELVALLRHLLAGIEAAAELGQGAVVALLERRGMPAAAARALWAARPRTLDPDPAGLELLADLRRDAGAAGGSGDPSLLRRLVDPGPLALARA